jgi:hypothetical protein
MIELLARLTAIAIVLQTVEFLQLRGRTAALFAGCKRPHAWLLWVRLVVALTATVAPHAALFAILLVTNVQLALLWRGSFNGGSDFMTLTLTGASTLALAWPPTTRGVLLYVAVITCNSYFIAGLAKLRTWRSGEALRGFLARSLYQPPPTTMMRSARPLSWLVLALECGFPLVLVSPQLARVILPVMLVFHVGNAWVFGLNRFFFAWLAAYPALWACSTTMRP